MKKLFAISTLAVGILAAAQSAQAAVVLPIDGDSNPVPGVTRVHTDRTVVRQLRLSSNPMNAFAAMIVPVRPMSADLGIDGDANPVWGTH